MPTLQQLCSVILLQIIHLELHVESPFVEIHCIVYIVLIYCIVLYYLDIVFGSKHISVSDAQKPILNFTLITRHNFMACDLELHAISIKRCFGVVSALRQFLLTALVFLISFSAQHNYPYKNSFLYLQIQFLLILQDYLCHYQCCRRA